jgi:hypothetical protein
VLPRSVSVGRFCSTFQINDPFAAEKPRSRPSMLRTTTTPEPIAGAASTSLPIACRQRSCPVAASSASKSPSAVPNASRPSPKPGPAVSGNPVLTDQSLSPFSASNDTTWPS